MLLLLKLYKTWPVSLLPDYPYVPYSTFTTSGQMVHKPVGRLFVVYN